MSAIGKQLRWQDVQVAAAPRIGTERASLAKRLQAFFIDYLLGLLGAMSAIWIGSLSNRYLDLTVLGMNALVGIGVAFILNHLVLGTFSGQTVGKKMLGLQVVLGDGHPPEWHRLLGRCTLGYALSVIPLGLGLLWALWDPDGQTWHDKLFSTHVVKVVKQ